MTTQTVTRYLGKCGLGHKVALDLAAGENNNPANYTCHCGNIRILKAVVGRVTDHQCGARCTSSIGPVCDCECGGRNHGSDHSH